MPTPLWRPAPAHASTTLLNRFREAAERRTGQPLPDYPALWRWSVDDRAGFWRLLAEEMEVRFHGDPGPTLKTADHLMRDRWFPDARLNYAEHLLRFEGSEIALLGVDERGGPPRVWTRDALRDAVSRLQVTFRRLGIGPGHRVAAWMPNREETAIAMLAATALGATFSSSSPDFGVEGVLRRFQQIQPTVLLTSDGAWYNGKPRPHGAKLDAVVDGLRESLRSVIVVPVLGAGTDVERLPGGQWWKDALSPAPTPLTFHPVPFDHPLFILYSSGTTGAPKCIVHGHGGTLLQHLKEHRLHTDVRPGDRLFYYTTCGWMMWNWLISGLASGATVVLWDGSPVRPQADALWRLAADHQITHFGTSPKYLGLCRDHPLTPGATHDLSALRVILSTGAPLSEDLFHWVYDQVHANVQLASISGGTDIISCFMLGVPTAPVYPGEIQGRGLAMDVEAVDEHQRPVRSRQGELVCRSSFPSMPVGFWGDDTGERYRQAYFERFPGVWHHGDFIEITDQGGVIVYGRSDATLNPGGVRIGTAEIDAPVEGLAEVSDAIVVGMPVDDDVAIVLFVVPAPGVSVDDALRQKIRTAVRQSATPRHVPQWIFAAPAIPRTVSGKKVEIAVRSALLGHDIPNRDALANPEAIDWFLTEGRATWRQAV